MPIAWPSRAGGAQSAIIAALALKASTNAAVLSPCRMNSSGPMRSTKK
jgi:hypothetical protein